MWKPSALLAVALVACGGPSVPVDYLEEFGGLESQYEMLLTSEDCQYLGERASLMDQRYNADRSDRIALGYQRAAVDRMVELGCP